jgi:hypothetical protein
MFLLTNSPKPSVTVSLLKAFLLVQGEREGRYFQGSSEVEKTGIPSSVRWEALVACSWELGLGEHEEQGGPSPQSK